jgi:hypothetical protein
VNGDASARRPRRGAAGTLIALVGILVVAYGVRRPTIPNTFASECWDALNSVRLHYTAFFNVKAYIMDNFFKSILHTMHGTYDSLFLYSYSGLLDTLHVPITVFNLGLGEVLLSLAGIVVVYFVGRSYFNPVVGLIAAALLAVSTRAVSFAALSYFYNTTVFTLGVFLLAIRWYHRRLDTWSALLLGVVVFVGSGSELVAFFPVWLVICDAFLLREAHGTLTAGTLRRFYLRPHTLLIWMPIPLMVLVHYYIYTRVGVGGSNLGMIGIAMVNYGGNNDPATAALQFVELMKAVISSTWSAYLMVAMWAGLVYLYVKGRLPKANMLAMFWLVMAVIAAVLSVKRGIASSGSDRSFHLLVPASVFSAAALYYLFRAMNWPLRAAGIVALVLVLRAPVMSLPFALHPSFTPSPLEAAGWYVRTYGHPYTTRVFNLIPDIGVHHNSEFWYGKQMMRDFTDPGDLHPPDHYRKAIFGVAADAEPVDVSTYDFAFDFVVVLRKFADRDYVRRNLSFLNAHGYTVVATVIDHGAVVADIYSPHALPRTEMDLYEYSDRWGHDYGRLATLLEHNRIGLASYWGGI